MLGFWRSVSVGLIGVLFLVGCEFTLKHDVDGDLGFALGLDEGSQAEVCFGADDDCVSDSARSFCLMHEHVGVCVACVTDDNCDDENPCTIDECSIDIEATDGAFGVTCEHREKCTDEGEQCIFDTGECVKAEPGLPGEPAT